MKNLALFSKAERLCQLIKNCIVIITAACLVFLSPLLYFYLMNPNLPLCSKVNLEDESNPIFSKTLIVWSAHRTYNIIFLLILAILFYFIFRKTKLKSIIMIPLITGLINISTDYNCPRSMGYPAEWCPYDVIELALCKYDSSFISLIRYSDQYFEGHDWPSEEAYKKFPYMLKPIEKEYSTDSDKPT
jgi:hypothetical protein